MVKLAVIIPTFGAPNPKLRVTLDHVRRSAPDTPIIVHDDCTPNEDEVAGQQNLCKMFDAEHRRRSHWGHMSSNYHDGCVEAHRLWEPDVFVIIQDDFIITPRWFKSLQYFWDKNWDQPIGSAGFRFAEAWELVSSGIIKRDNQFWEVDWIKNEVYGSDIKWNLEITREAIENGNIQTKTFPPNEAIEIFDKMEVPPDRFPPSGCKGLSGTTNAHMTVRAEAFNKVGGLEGLPLYIFDLEFGWKLWKAGYWNIEIPGPIGLHYAGAASSCAHQAGVLSNSSPMYASYMWPGEAAKEAFKDRWGSDDHTVVDRKFLEKFVFPFNNSEVELSFL